MYKMASTFFMLIKGDMQKFILLSSLYEKIYLSMYIGMWNLIKEVFQIFLRFHAKLR